MIQWIVGLGLFSYLQYAQPFQDTWQPKWFFEWYAMIGVAIMIVFLADNIKDYQEGRQILRELEK